MLAWVSKVEGLLALSDHPSREHGLHRFTSAGGWLGQGVTVTFMEWMRKWRPRDGFRSAQSSSRMHLTEGQASLFSKGLLTGDLYTPETQLCSNEGNGSTRHPVAQFLPTGGSQCMGQGQVA